MVGDNCQCIMCQYLRTELFRRQLEGGDNLLGQHSGVRETKGEQTDLGNESVVRHHHSHGTEQSLGKQG